MAISPDGRWLVTGSEDKTARLWHLRLNDLMDLARRTLGRELTDEERKPYRLPGPSAEPPQGHKGSEPPSPVTQPPAVTKENGGM